MPLADVIQIVPLATPVSAEIPVPGSKSITNRALILAALAQGETVLSGALWSEDTQVMVESLSRLGFEVRVQPDAHEPCNRCVRVFGQGGRIPRGGKEPLELFVGNAGTAARFVAALACLGQGVYRLSGVPRMHERPQAALFEALRQLGYQVQAAQERLPALIFGDGPHPGRSCQVSLEESSQFASALLLAAQAGGWKVDLLGESAEESPYVEMTERLIAAFGKSRGRYQVEVDASSGSYFIAANYLLQLEDRKAGREPAAAIVVPNWPQSGWQADAAFPKYLPLPEQVSRAHDLADSIMTAVVLAPFAGRTVRFTDLGRLRVQECERVAALRTELTKCGGKVSEEGDALVVQPSSLHGAAIETYNDHRMAMCFAILGLKIPGIKIKNPACVKKTFPNFFQKLAAPPPGGLGAVLLDGCGQELGLEALFAD